MPLARKQISQQYGDRAKLVFVVSDGMMIHEPVLNGHPVMHMTDFLEAGATETYFNVAFQPTQHSLVTLRAL